MTGVKVSGVFRDKPSFSWVRKLKRCLRKILKQEGFVTFEIKQEFHRTQLKVQGEWFLIGLI